MITVSFGSGVVSPLTSNVILAAVVFAGIVSVPDLRVCSVLSAVPPMVYVILIALLLVCDNVTGIVTGVVSPLPPSKPLVPALLKFANIKSSLVIVVV